MHLELLSYSATAPSTGAAAAAATGDSLTIKNSNGPARIIAWWTKAQTLGYHQLTYPSAHDSTRAIRVLAPVGVAVHDLPAIELKPQELMTLTIVGSATAGDVEAGAMLIWYRDLPGTTARLINAAELDRRRESPLSVYVTQASTAGIYGVEELINAESDLLKANSDYAVLGIDSSLTTLSNNLRGPDIGNVRIGSPPPSPLTNTHVTEDWFYRLSQRTGLATIPVISSGNRASTYIGQSTDENAAASVQAVHLQLLK